MARPLGTTTSTINNLALKVSQFWLSNWRLWVLIIVHVVGVIGLSQQAPIRDMFLWLTPVNLLLTLYLFVGAAEGRTGRQIGLLVLIGVLGFLVEVAGVHTGLIFGNYWYGASLGFKVVHVPVVIGVNWVILVYAMTCWLGKLGLSGVWRAILGAVLLTALDWVMEPVAVSLDFWQWQQNTIPVRNYIGWFGTSFTLLLLSGQLEPKWKNKLAGSVLLIELLFFVILRLLLLT